MPITVQDIYQEVCFDCFEDSGLVLGIVTLAQFIDLLNLTLTDLATQTGIVLKIFTQTVQAGVGQYSVPNPIIRAEDCFLGGVYLEPSDVQELNNSLAKWRYVLGPPFERWHGDELPPQTVEVVFKPNYNGAFIRGANFPDPPNGQFGDWSMPVETSPGVFTTQSAQQTGALTIVGPALPDAIAATTDPLPFADDICLSCLAFGVLERIFSGDNELKDPQRALWCSAQYRESIAILSAITNEPDEG